MKLLVSALLAVLTTTSPTAASGLRDHPVQADRIVVRVSSSTGDESLSRVLVRHAHLIDDVTSLAAFDQILQLGRPLPETEMRALLHDIGSEPGLFAARMRTWSEGRWVHATRQLYLRFEEHVAASEQRRVLEAYPGIVIQAEGFGGVSGMWLLESTGSTEDDVLRVVDTLASLPQVSWANINRALDVARTNVDPPDCKYQVTSINGQWYLNNRIDAQYAEFDVDAHEGWCVTTGSASAKIAVLDDGIDTSHPDLNWSAGQDFTNSPVTLDGAHILSTDRHGTTVAGIVSAKIDNTCCSCPGLNVGVAPDSRVISLRVLHSGTEYAWMINALSWAESNGIRATVSSFVLPYDSGLAAAYDTTRSNGLMHFASSGETGTSTLPFPASQPSTVAIGAIDYTGQRTTLSNYGTGLFAVAPGANIIVLDRMGSLGFSPADHAFLSGTSYSTPMVAGVAALAWSARPELSADDMDWVLEQSCKDIGPAGYDAEYGHGIPDAGVAVDVARDRHVDQTVGISGAGTLTDPYRTIAEGVTTVPDGRRILVAPGVYTEAFLASRPMEIRAE